MITIDTSGKSCPLPLIEAKKQLVKLAQDEIFQLISDSKTTLHNLERFIPDNGGEIVELVTKENSFVLTIQLKNSNKAASAKVEDYCEIPVPEANLDHDMIIAIDSDTMGKGNDELGRMLLAGFLSSLENQDKIPSKILLYNTGVLLTKQDSPNLPTLLNLEKKGVEIVLCGNCTNFFGMTEKPLVGAIGNMYNLVGTLQKAKKIFKP